jgi:hypothetical protein
MYTASRRGATLACSIAKAKVINVAITTADAASNHFIGNGKRRVWNGQFQIAASSRLLGSSNEHRRQTAMLAAR